MNVTTKSQDSLAAFFESTGTLVGGTVLNGSVEAGDFTNWYIRSLSDYYQVQNIFTNADSYENLSPSILDLSGWPIVDRQEGASDFGTIRLTKGQCKTDHILDLRTIGTTSEFKLADSLISDTLLSFTHGLVYAAVSASGKDNEYYSSPITTGSMYQGVSINADCWAAGWDFSGVPIWNSSGGSGGGPYHGGALITERHLVEAEHFRSPVGTVFIFKAPNGTLVSRTSIGMNARSTSSDYLTSVRENDIPGDIRVHVLDSPVPSNIKVYDLVGQWAFVNPVAGSQNDSYTWQTSVTLQMPYVGMYLDQARRAYAMGSYSNDCETETYSVAETEFAGESIALDYQRVGFTMRSIGTFEESINSSGRFRFGVSGDSGGACFLPLSSSEMALLTCLTVPGGGPWYGEDRMNLLIASADSNAGVSTGLTVTVAPNPTS